MDPDVTLEWILGLCSRLDAAIEHAHPIDPDAVYALVGLVAELDAHLALGAHAPRRWRVALGAQPAGLLVIDPSQAASNDAARPLARRHGRSRARSRGASRDDAAQLALPFATLAG